MLRGAEGGTRNYRLQRPYSIPPTPLYPVALPPCPTRLAPRCPVAVLHCKADYLPSSHLHHNPIVQLSCRFAAVAVSVVQPAL